jgi:hypothetical protein
MRYAWLGSVTMMNASIAMSVSAHERGLSGPGVFWALMALALLGLTFQILENEE